MIRRKKLTIFTDCKDTTTVLELKKIINGITKEKVENMMLLKDGLTMDDGISLQNYGLSSTSAKVIFNCKLILKVIMVCRLRAQQ